MKSINKKQKNAVVPKVVKNDHSYLVLEPVDFEDHYFYSFNSLAEAEKYSRSVLEDTQGHPRKDELHIFQRIGVLHRSRKKFNPDVKVIEIEVKK